MTVQGITSALLDFRRARRRAELEVLLARLTGKSVDLLCYDDVRDKLDGALSPGKELEDIELDRIVGSVGRCTDFTRSFLPRQDSDADRWARTEVRMADLAGLPPVEVYELGGVYFVQDGHHRVSVAKHSGADYIQAYVTKVRTRVSLASNADADDVIIEAEHSDFLSRTNLDVLRPESDFTVSVPGQHRKLLEHIDVHRYFMGLDEERPVPYQEAVAHWYDHVYRPLVEVVQAQRMLEDFPGRTDADLYLWVAEHRHALRERLGWEVTPSSAAEDLAEQFGGTRRPVLKRVSAALRTSLIPSSLQDNPPPGEWPKERRSSSTEERLFRDVLVAIDGQSAGWRALQQAGLIAQLDELRVHGVHILPSGLGDDDAQSVADAFAHHLEEMDLVGDLTLKQGEVADELIGLARWTDVVVVGLDYPPGVGPLARLGSGIRSIVSRSPRPVLFVPREPLFPDRAVIAYDGSPKAEEALFVATHMAEAWGTHLTVVTVQEPGQLQPGTLKPACRYLAQHSVEAEAIAASGSPAEGILETVESVGAQLIVMGGYGYRPILELVLGSTVDQVLRESLVPVLVCT